MDFHPSVTSATHSGIKIPFYDNAFFKYDPRKAFSSYPAQKSIANFTDDIFNLEIPEMLSAIQSWLFFGLMTEIFDALDVTLREEDFILEDAGSRYISTRNLRRYLWYCIGNLKNMLFDEEEGLGQGLKNRKTTKPEDEVICLSVLLGIDVQSILDKPSQDRMKCLFQTIDNIRPAIVFSDGPRIHQDGFRWAPSSFLRPEKHPQEPGFHPGRGVWAERHPMGLLVNFDGFLLPKPPVESVFAISTEERSYTVHLRPPLRPSKGVRVAVIHELQLSELEDERFSTRAILVEVTHVQDGIQFTLFSGVGKIVRSIDRPCESIRVDSRSLRWCIG
jgi:hypothetical protein